VEERKDVGKALSPEEQDRLLDAAKNSRSPHLQTFVPLLLLTGMRRDEALRLTWGQLDLQANTVTVGRAKTSSGTGRIIPLAPELQAMLAAHRRDWMALWNEPRPEHFVFVSSKPTSPTTTVKKGWGTLRRNAGVSCRLHDLRHTFATRLAEAGVQESTMLAIMGHMSRAMLERYSHIRMAAKREAVAGLTLYSRERVPLKVPLPVVSAERQQAATAR
jgi:integrase